MGSSGTDSRASTGGSVRGCCVRCGDCTTGASGMVRGVPDDIIGGCSFSKVFCAMATGATGWWIPLEVRFTPLAISFLDWFIWPSSKGGGRLAPGPTERRRVGEAGEGAGSPTSTSTGAGWINRSCGLAIRAGGIMIDSCSSVATTIGVGGSTSGSAHTTGGVTEYLGLRAGSTIVPDSVWTRVQRRFWGGFVGVFGVDSSVPAQLGDPAEESKMYPGAAAEWAWPERRRTSRDVEPEFSSANPPRPGLPKSLPHPLVLPLITLIAPLIFSPWFPVRSEGDEFICVGRGRWPLSGVREEVRSEFGALLLDCCVGPLQLEPCAVPLPVPLPFRSEVRLWGIR